MAAPSLKDRRVPQGRAQKPALQVILPNHYNCIDLVSRNSSSPYLPISRPWPDCL